MKSILFLIVLVFAAGCVTQQAAGGGLSMKLQPDPPQIFSQSDTVVHVDLENENPRRISDVQFNVFDTGRLSKVGGECSIAIGTMLPNEFKSFSCTLAAPALVDEPSIVVPVSASVTYTTDLSAAQIVEMMTEDEYNNRVSRGSFAQKPQSYTYSDRNAAIAVDFSEPLPVIVRPGKDYFIYFTIRNIGNGLIDSLHGGDFSVVPVKSLEPATSAPVNILDCSAAGFSGPTWRLDPVGAQFPRIACRISLPQGVKVVENYGLLVTLNYRYEVRESAQVTVVR